MISYFRSIRKPLGWVAFPKIQYFFGLFLDAMIFPMEQICVGLMQKFLVNAVEYHDRQFMLYIVWLAAAIMLMVFIMNPLADCMKENAMQIYDRNLRELAIDRLLTCDFSFFEKCRTGEVMTRFRDDLNKIPYIYTETVFRFLLGIFYGGGSLLIMFTFCWQLSIVVIVLCVFETYLVAVLSKAIERKTESLQKIADEKQQILFDLIRNLRFIKIFCITSWVENRFQEAVEKTVEKKLEINKTNVCLKLLREIFNAMNLLLIFGFGVLLYLWGQIDLGSVMAFLFLQDGISYMFGNFQDFFAGMNAQSVSCNRVEELLKQISGGLPIGGDLPADRGRTPAAKRLPADICIRSLSFQYPSSKEAVLKEVNLTIPKGKLTVLYGDSGCGKSTLLKILLALYRPNTGEICIGGKSYDQMAYDEIRGYYAYVEQSPYLFHDTLEANIRGNRVNASLEEVTEAAKSAGAHEFIVQNADGYQTIVSEHGDNFSGGEKQRIAIARAILQDAPIVVLDEATSGVDFENETILYGKLREMTRQGKTVLVVTHREQSRQFTDHEIRIPQ